MQKILVTTAMLGLLAACNSEPPVPSAETFYADNCAACHGATGRGDGPVAEAQAIKPPDLTRIAARNGGTFPRVRVMSQIDGYSRAGHGTMPEFGEILMGQTMLIDTGGRKLTPTPVRLVELNAYIESLQRP